MDTIECKRHRVRVDHINAQSFLAHKDEINLLINERETDILCVSETWLIPEILDEHISIPGYVSYRCDKGRGGGVCVFVKNIFKVTRIEVNIERPTGIEDIWLGVQSNNLPTVVIGCMYRHPKSLSTTFDYIIDILDFVMLRNKMFYLLGDFNDDLLSNKSRLKKIIHNAKLVSLVSQPTRITSTSATLLDTIVTNKPESVLQSDVIPCLVGDHELITVTINLKKPKILPSFKTFRDFRNYSPEVVCNQLLQDNHNLNKIYATDNIDMQVKIFTECFKNCLNVCAPLITKEVKRPPAPWMCDELKQLIREKNNVRGDLKLDRNNIQLQERHKTLKKQVKRLIINSKINYYDKKFQENKGNSSVIWKLLRELIPISERKSCDSVVEEGENVKSRADTFNKFFANVGKETFMKSQQNAPNDQLMSNAVTQDICNLQSSSFRPQPVNSDTIILIIKSMKNSNSCGCDGIQLQFLKDSLPVVIPYITCILNTSIVTGTFPQQWKEAIIVPILKSGNTDEPQNYRPISLLPILSKILEKVIACQLSNYLEENHLLSNTQHGFRARLSTETALTTLTNLLYDNIDNKKISLITLCDLSKAFDSVNHIYLVSKLTKLNIDNFWFESYLHNRTQRVRMGKTLSEICEVSYGVPQGSVLGPILFLIYVNDFSQHIPHCHVLQYADDTQLIHTGTIDKFDELILRGENTLALAKNYFEANGLMLNTKKTQCMFVGSRNYISEIPPNTTLRVDGSEIVASKSLKNLGIHFDNYLNFDTHINEIRRKTLGTLIYINRIKDNLNKNARLISIHSLVLSNINYGIKIWGATYTTYLNQVQKLQNFAAKITLGGGAKRDHATPFLRELGWLRIDNKYKYELGLMIYNVIKCNTPNHLMSLPKVRDIRSLPTRQQQQLYVPKTNTLIGERSVLVAGPKLWNTLPTKVRNANTQSSFKKQLFHHLLRGQINT